MVNALGETVTVWLATTAPVWPAHLSVMSCDRRLRLAGRMKQSCSRCLKPALSAWHTFLIGHNKWWYNLWFVVPSLNWGLIPWLQISSCLIKQKKKKRWKYFVPVFVYGHMLFLLAVGCIALSFGICSSATVVLYTTEKINCKCY